MRKFLSIFLALAMTLSLLPTFALAEESEVKSNGNIAENAPDWAVAVYTISGDTEVTMGFAATVNEAVNAVSEGGEVTLLKSCVMNEKVSIGKTVTLDLNGYTITGKANQLFTLGDKKNGPGHLTVRDTAGDGKIITENYQPIFFYRALSSFTLLGGTIECGYTIKSPNTTSQCGVVYSANKQVTVNIEDGTLCCTGTNQKWNYALFVGGSTRSTLYQGRAAVNISGGTIISEKAIAVYIKDDADASISGTAKIISGSEKSAMHLENETEDRCGTIKISGGTFSSDPSAYLAGNACMKQEGAKYIVAASHSYSDTWSSDETNHWHAATCGHDVKKDTAPHSVTTDPAVEATCTKDGKTEGSHCSVCGKIFTLQETIPALNHDMTHHDALEATCTVSGNIEYWSCAKCGKNFSDDEGLSVVENATIASTGHDMTHHDALEATCTVGGNIEYWSCAKCGKNFSDAAGTTEVETVTTSATGHTEAIDEAIAATCTEAGKTEGKHCSVCNAVIKAQEVIPATGHSWGSWEKVNDEQHKHVCGNDVNHVETAAHTWDAGEVTKAATCTEAGVKTYTCTVCNATKTEPVAATGHAMVKTDAKAATENEAGNREYYTCNNCHKYFSDELGTTEIGENSWIIPASNERVIAYHVDKTDGLVIAGNIPTTTGKYTLVFSPSGSGEPYETGISSNKYAKYPLDFLFVGKPAAVYDQVEWMETKDDVTSLVAKLEKTLTTEYRGDAIKITKIDATKNAEHTNMWDFVIETEQELELEAGSNYLFHYITLDGKGHGGGSIRVKDGKLVGTRGSSNFADGVMIYIVKSSGAVDGDGNATLTFTPLGEGKQWTAPADSGNTGGNTGGSTSSGSSSSGSTTTKTETTTNPDGSTTKTETKADGTTVETTTGKDGTTTKTESKTETKSDGSKVETKTETVTAKDGSKTETESKTEVKPDGSSVETKTETVTAKDGSKTESKTETTTAADGSKTETKSETKTAADGTKTETENKTETKADGTTTGTETRKTTDVNGSTGTTTTTTKNGNTKTEAEAKISEKAAEEAKKNDAPVTAPVEVKAGESSDSAPTVKIELPKDTGETKVEIPVSNVNSGTVAVIVNEDGTEEIVKNAIVTENGVVLGVEGNTTVKIIDNSKDFIDTRNHWSRDEVNFVAARELFNGVGNNLFGVSGDMTRGMVNTVLARLAGEDTNGGANWYDKGTEWAKKNGITDGANPTANITREQLAAMLYRFAGSPAVSGELSFADADQISGYAKDALLWAVQNGILNGIGNNLIAPKNSAERAQVAAMMARYLKNVG